MNYLKAIFCGPLSSFFENKNINIHVIGFENTVEDILKRNIDHERGASQIKAFIQTIKNNPQKYSALSQKEFNVTKSTTFDFFRQAYLDTGCQIDIIVTDQKSVNEIRGNMKTTPIFILTLDNGLTTGSNVDDFYYFLTINK